MVDCNSSAAASCSSLIFSRAAKKNNGGLVRCWEDSSVRSYTVNLYSLLVGSSYCFRARAMVSVVCSIVLSKSIKQFMWDFTTAASQPTFRDPRLIGEWALFAFLAPVLTTLCLLTMQISRCNQLSQLTGLSVSCLVVYYDCEWGWMISVLSFTLPCKFPGSCPFPPVNSPSPPPWDSSHACKQSHSLHAHE